MDPSSLDAIDRLIRNPPAIVVLIVVTLLVTHALKHISVRADLWSGRQGKVIIGVIELVITLVIAILTLKAFLFQSFLPLGHSAAWHELPFALLVALMVFGLVSMIALWVFNWLK